MFQVIKLTIFSPFLKNIQAELEYKGVVLSNSHVKGMALMKFLSDEAAASRSIDQELAQLDRRWNAMAKEILARMELVCNFRNKCRVFSPIFCSCYSY